MKNYKGVITLVKNNRGCYILDTVKGCRGVCSKNPNGCYGDCYANNIALRYGFDFKTTVKRDFIKDTDQLYLFDFYDMDHQNDIIKQIERIDMPFVRIGEMGDPSVDWEHTINICDIISAAKKPIVIITKHWTSVPDNLLPTVGRINITINTSVSALDDIMDLDYRIGQYERLKPYCNSVLRVVSCDFNKNNEEGQRRYDIQERIFKNDKTIDTVFRPSAKNELITNNIINVKKVNFLKSKVLASVHSDNTYLGYCGDCPDMCGVNL